MWVVQNRSPPVGLLNPWHGCPLLESEILCPCSPFSRKVLICPSFLVPVQSFFRGVCVALPGCCKKGASQRRDLLSANPCAMDAKKTTLNEATLPSAGSSLTSISCILGPPVSCKFSVQSEATGTLCWANLSCHTKARRKPPPESTCSKQTGTGHLFYSNILAKSLGNQWLVDTMKPSSSSTTQASIFRHSLPALWLLWPSVSCPGTLSGVKQYGGVGCLGS